jgi:hypothetical protein
MTNFLTISVLLAMAVFAVSAQRPTSADPARTNAVATTPRSLKAQEFMEMFGINVHFHEYNYQNIQAMAEALNSIGVSHVRSSCTSTAEVSAWKQLAAKTAAYFPAGLKADVLINGYLNAPDVTLVSQEALIPQIAPIIESIEGPNEINNYYVGNGTHGPFDKTDQTKNFAVNSRNWALALSKWQKKTPTLTKTMLIAPSIASGDPQDYARLPDISSAIRLGNIHFYAGNGRPPSNFGGGNFAAIYQWYQAAATPGKRLAVTECGQTTASRPGQGGCDEATQAKYLLNQMCDAAAVGAARAYVYQLMDDTSDGDPTGNGGAEAHFGLFDYHWHPKPAAQALANVKNLLSDTPKRFTTKVPNYSVTGLTQAGAAGSSLALSKSDGSTFLVVWNEPPLWNAQANTPLTAPNDMVTVSFGKRYSYKVYDPLRGLHPIAVGQASQVHLNVPGSPIFIQLIPIR